jgi:hypothetical protein
MDLWGAHSDHSLLPQALQIYVLLQANCTHFVPIVPEWMSLHSFKNNLNLKPRVFSKWDSRYWFILRQVPFQLWAYEVKHIIFPKYTHGINIPIPKERTGKQEKDTRSQASPKPSRCNIIHSCSLKSTYFDSVSWICVLTKCIGLCGPRQLHHWGFIGTAHAPAARHWSCVPTASPG